MASSSFSRNTGLSTATQFFVYILLFLQLTSVTNAGKLSNFCKSLNCFSPEDSDPKQNFAKPSSASITCPNPQAPKDAKGWNVYKHAKPMPSVQDIVADIKLCGILSDKTSTVFYSFNANEPNFNRVNEFIKKRPDLNGKTINHILPDSWYDALAQVPGISVPHSLAQIAWTARTSQALAAASSGTTYLVAGGGANIYTVPYAPGKEKKDIAWRGAHNVWYDYEFATLQNNNAVKAIYTVNAKTYAIEDSAATSWVRDRNPQGDKAGNHVDANKVTATTLEKQKADYLKKLEQEEQQGNCDQASKSNGKRAAGKSSASGKATASGAACTLKPKTTSTVQSAGKLSGTSTPTVTANSKTQSSAKPTTLVTKTSSSKSAKTNTAPATKTSAKASKTSAKASKTKTSAKATKTSCPKRTKKC